MDYEQPVKRRRMDGETENSDEEECRNVQHEISSSTDSSLCSNDHDNSDDEDTEMGGVSDCYVKEISATNFMCHDNLQIKLGSGLNFVTGRNGAGKSAIMTALVIGLGERAGTMSRGTSYKHLIKRGKHKATIHIIISNTGICAYQPEVFGEVIYVDRVLTHSGLNEVIISNEWKKVISKKAKDLKNLTFRMNIQPGNPVCMLSQETTKTFLTNSNPSKFYHLFDRATQLDHIKENYMEVDHALEVVNEAIDGKKVEMDEKKKNLKKLKRRLESTQLREKYEKEISKMEVSIKYIHLHSLEDKKHELTNRLMRIEEKCRNLQEEHDRLSQTNNMNIDVDACEEEKREIIEKTSKIKMELNEHRNELRLVQNEYTDNETRITTLKREKNMVVGDIEALKREIDKSGWNKENVVDLEIEGNLDQELKELKVDITKKSNQISQLQMKLRELNSIKNNVRQNIPDIMNDLKYRIDEQRQLEQQLIYLKEMNDPSSTNLQNENDRSTSEQVETNGKWKQYYYSYNSQAYRQDDNIRNFKCDPRLFHPKIFDLFRVCDRLYRNRQISSLPLGPLGAYITPKNAKWSLAIERCLEKIQSNFVVSSAADQKVISNEFRSICQQTKSPVPTIIINRQQKNDKIHDVSQFRPQGENFSILLDLVSYFNVGAINNIIELMKIESIGLFPSREMAVKLMKTHPVQFLVKGYTSNGDMFLATKKFRSYANTRGNNLKLYTNDPQKLMREAENKLDYLNGMVNRLQMDCEKDKEHIGNIERDEENTRNNLEDLSVERIEGMKRKENVEQQLIDIGTTKKKMFIHQECRNQQNHLIEIDQDLEDLGNRQYVIGERQSTVEKEIRKCRHNLNDFSIDINRIEAMKQNHFDTVRSNQRTLERFDNQMKVEEEMKLNTEQKVNSLDEKIQKQILILGDDEPLEGDIHNMSVEELNHEIDKKRIQIGGIEDISFEQQASLKEKYIVDYNQLKSMSDLFGSEYKCCRFFSRFIVQRKKAIIQVRDVLRETSEIEFSSILKSRDLLAEFVFDDDKKTLELHVTQQRNIRTSNNRRLSKQNIFSNKQMCDVRYLSGGERSVTTTAFLLSLWSVIDSPIFCIDEIDVCMDQVNREITTNLLLQNLHVKNKQCILITPQDISFITKNKFFSEAVVFELEPPKR
ncbi:hypothetical protein SNEBB_009721 [Seison nebaliae]|nr:hypothetical protein SNEBB_009721 [Seison nebaliae]